MLERIYSFLFNKVTICCFLFIAFWILGHNTIEKFLNDFIVGRFLEDAYSSIPKDLLFFIVLTIALFYTVYKKNLDYHPSKILMVILILLSVIYLYYRVSDTVWYFVPVHSLTVLKYFDILLFITFLNVVLFIHPRKENHTEKNDESFTHDEPVACSKKDKLGYSKYAQSIANKIDASKFETAFAIGINGEWGSGKTSFFNLIKEHLKDDRAIIIDFSAWNSNTPKAIIQDFFETLQDSVKPYHSTIARQFLNYSNKLITLNDGNINQIINSTLNIFHGFDPANSQFSEINNSLAKIDRKIVVFIDDLDRLDKEEVIEVIRLIRNTANFNNLFFVVAYDRSYIVNALKTLAPDNNKAFLEKIFQLEISLPYYRKSKLKHELVYRLKEMLPEENYNDIDKSISYGGLYNNNDIIPWFENLRDVTRYGNSLALNYARLKGEVEFYDLLRLELIRVKYPSVHKVLFNMADVFLNEEIKNDIRFSRLKKIKSSEIETPYRFEIEKYLDKNFKRLSIPKNSINKIVNLLNSVFSGGVRIPENSVVFPNKFERYSSYAIQDGDLSSIEFSKARSNLNQTAFNGKIEEWVSNRMEFDLCEKLERIKNFNNKEDFELILRGIFHLKSQNSKIIPNKNVSYNDALLIELLSKESVKNLFIREEYKSFLIQILKNENSAYVEKSYLLNYLIKEKIDYNIPFTIPELIKISIGYLEHHCNTMEKWDNLHWELFYNTAKHDRTNEEGSFPRNGLIILKKSKDILRNFIKEKGLDGLIIDIIKSQSEGKYTIQNYVADIYEGDWNSFEDYINTEDESRWQHLKEFKLFFQEFKRASYREVAFSFTGIPVIEKKASTSPLEL